MHRLGLSWLLVSITLGFYVFGIFVFALLQGVIDFDHACSILHIWTVAIWTGEIIDTSA
jgi:hypothetical protein